MEDRFIAATDREPEVALHFSKRYISLKGEAYPEDAAAFWGPIINALKNYLTLDAQAGLTLDIELLYFNSSSAKALMNILNALDEAAQQGGDFCINWYCQEEDETIQEFGEEFSESLQYATFKIETLTI